MPCNCDSIADTRWSHYADGYHARLADGTATITLKQLKREWRDWDASQRVDFCLSFAFAHDIPDRFRILRFLVANGDHDCWPVFAHSLPSEFWPDEAVEILCQWADSCPAGEASSYLNALGILHLHKDHEQEISDARSFLRRYLKDTMLTEGLISDSVSCNEIAYDALVCVESLVSLGEDREILRGPHHLLRTHPCAEIRRLTECRISQSFCIE